MGMFLSKYSMLRALGYGDDSYVLPETKRVLSKFKLFGLIIHDPNVHSDFHRKLMESFDMLDYITGRDFLFFTVVDLQNDRLRNENRDYFGAWESEKLFSPGNTYQSTDKSITAYSLATTLGIEYSDLPAIILTNNFQFDQFHYVKTCPRHLEFQLQEVGFFCSQQKELFSILIDSKFKELIHKIDQCGGSRNVKLASSMAKLLSDFIAFLVPRSSSMDYSKARAQIQNNLRRTSEERAMLKDDDSIDQYYISLLGKLANYKSIGMSGEHKSEIKFQKIVEEEPAVYDNHQMVYSFKSEFDDVPINEFEPESRVLYNTYKLIYPYYSEIVSELRGNVDYTPLLISLTKTFEIELNMSIVQWIRKYLGIEMPRYFNIHKESSTDYSFTPSSELVRSPLPIDFNKGYRDKWHAPGIGQSELVATTLFRNGNYPRNQFNEIRFQGFLIVWRTMRIYRNKASHTEPINELQFKSVLSDFKSLTENYLYELFKIKTELRK